MIPTSQFRNKTPLQALYIIHGYGFSWGESAQIVNYIQDNYPNLIHW